MVHNCIQAPPGAFPALADSLGAGAAACIPQPPQCGIQCGRAGLDPMAVCVWDGGQDRVRHESCLACCAVCWKPAARKGCEGYRGNDVWLRSLSARRVIAVWIYERFRVAEARSPGPSTRFHPWPPAAAPVCRVLGAGQLWQIRAATVSWQECYIKVCTMPPCNVSHNQFHLLILTTLCDCRLVYIIQSTGMTRVVAWCVLLLKRRPH